MLKLVHMSKPIFSILEESKDPEIQKSEWPFEYLELNYDSRRYINVKLNNVEIFHDELGAKKTAANYYNITESSCSKDFFTNSAFEEQYYAEQ